MIIGLVIGIGHYWMMFNPVKQRPDHGSLDS